MQAGDVCKAGDLNILINEANFLLKSFQVFFKMVDLALHIAQQGIAALRSNVKEAQIIFISLNFSAFLFKSAYQSFAFTAKTVFIALHLPDISGKSLHTGTFLADIEMLIQMAHSIAVLFIHAILVAERHVAYGLPCGLKFLHLSDGLFTRGIVGNSFQGGNHPFFAPEVFALGTTLSRSSLLPAVKEIVARIKETTPDNIAMFFVDRPYCLPFLLEISDGIGGFLPLAALF